MQCDEFKMWLENKDSHNVSEADRAQKHAAKCAQCQAMLKKDELLDVFIAKSLAAVQMPSGFKNQADLDLSRAAGRRSSAVLLAVALVVCAAIALFLLLPSQSGFQTMDELSGYALQDYRQHGAQEEEFEPITDLGTWLAQTVRQQVAVPQGVPAGYAVVAGRFCQLGQSRVVHLLYKQGANYLSVYLIEAKEIEFPIRSGRTYTVSMNGSEVRIWREKDYVYVLVG